MNKKRGRCGASSKKMPLYRNVTGVTFIYIRKCDFCNEKVKKKSKPSDRIIHSVELLHNPLVPLNNLIDVFDA